MSDKPQKPIFLYDTAGDWQGVVIGSYLFDTRGEYMGFLEGRAVFTRDGEWVGELAKDGRILRKRSAPRKPLNPNLPPKPPKPANMPARAPLPPQNAEIGFDTVDVLEEDPEVFKRISDRRPDMGE